MTLEEIRTEAQKHGYKLVKEHPYVRMMPCICGHKNISYCSTFYSASGEKTQTPYYHQCRKCGLTSEHTKTKYQAKLKWNECVENARKEKTI